MPRSGAQRHAHSDFVTPEADMTGHHAPHSRAGQNQGGDSQDRHAVGKQPLARQLLIQPLAQRLHFKKRHRGIQAMHFVGDAPARLGDGEFRLG